MYLRRWHYRVLHVITNEHRIKAVDLLSTRGKNLLLGSLIAAILSWNGAVANEVKLPDLGRAGGGPISLEQEYSLGQKWLRMFRSQIPTTTDPFFQDYVERIVQSLAKYSALEDKRLDILVIENPTINAFAVPGGVIGVHTGLLKYAQTEQQFSSVLAHELGHLSQRHYARRIESQKDRQIPTLAAILASILIATAANGEAGIAAISTVQAASASASLAFSRQMEREADRVGMETLIRAGINPEAMPQMFEEMLKHSRHQHRPPEFLLTHPVTESRVSDSRARSQRHSHPGHPPSLEYSLLQTRVHLAHEANPNRAVNYFKGLLARGESSKEAAAYGLALAYMNTREFDKSQQQLTNLLQSSPDNIYYQIAQARLWTEEEQFQKAIQLLETHLIDYPRHHPTNVALAEILMKASEYKKCQKLLKNYVSLRPKDDYVWYLLAEINGLAGDILEVHIARAEYFLLNGLVDKAEIQLRNAMKLVKKDKYTRAKLEQKLKEAAELKLSLKER